MFDKAAPSSSDRVSNNNNNHNNNRVKPRPASFGQKFFTKLASSPGLIRQKPLSIQPASTRAEPFHTERQPTQASQAGAFPPNVTHPPRPYCPPHRRLTRPPLSQGPPHQTSTQALSGRSLHTPKRLPGSRREQRASPQPGPHWSKSLQHQTISQGIKIRANNNNNNNSFEWTGEGGKSFAFIVFDFLLLSFSMVFFGNWFCFCGPPPQFIEGIVEQCSISLMLAWNKRIMTNVIIW